MIEPEINELAVESPETYQRLVQGFKLLAGSTAAPDEIRAGWLPQTEHDDARRYVSGIELLDTIGGKIRPKELIVCGAITGQGKTSYAQRFALDNAINHRVLFATLEMTDEEIRDQLLGKIMRAPLDSVYAGRIGGHDDYYEAEAKLRELDLLLWHPARKDRSLELICKRAEDVTADLLIIDYTRKLRGWEPGWKATELVESLREWIKRTRITTLLLSQVKRPSDTRRSRPTIQDYQDTSALETTATRALILWRPFFGHPVDDAIVEVILGKNRFGKALMAHAKWAGRTADFYPMDEYEQENAACCRKRDKKH